MKKLLFTTAITIALTSPAFSSGSYSGSHKPILGGIKMAQADVKYSAGTIKKINAKAGKVTIIHGPLINLDMPAMTMVFRADEAMIANISVGQDIMFIADRVNGKLTVIKMK
jgi:Cu/Ag efflux protein CusF